MLGPKRCPRWLREAYKRVLNATCEDCLLKEGQKRKDKSIVRWEIHRIIPGYKGGTYRPGNVKGLCDRCHKNYGEKW